MESAKLAEEPNGSAQWSESAAREALARILASETFARPRRLRRLLTHIVERTLEGRQDALKEIVLGMEVFDRGPDFDPKRDPIVRMDARRLRSRLQHYYAQEGASESLEIALQPGSYIPLFRARIPASSSSRPAPREGSFGEFRVIVRGWYQLNHGSHAALLKSADCFQSVLQRDVASALAWAGLSAAHSLLVMHRAETPAIGWPKARTAAQRAMALDPGLPETHVAFGLIESLQEFRPSKGRYHFVQAIQANPDDRNSRICLASFCLAPLGELDAAETELRNVLYAAPLNPKALQALAAILYFQRRFDLAIEVAESALDVMPDNALAVFVLANAFDQLSRHQDAVKAFRRLETLLPGFGTFRWSRILDNLYKGQTKLAKAQRARMRAAALPISTWVHHSPFPAPSILVDLFLRLGDRERAIECMQQAFASRSYRALFLAVDPAFDSIRDDPRCKSLIEELQSTSEQASAMKAANASGE